MDGAAVDVLPSAALYDSVPGQERAVEQLRRSATRPVHAYLFAGPPGTGKLEAALGFAASLLCPHGGDATCRDCRRALAGTHPDLLVVEREGAYIRRKEADEIIRIAARTPVEGRRKVLVLVDFHLVQEVAPMLLKTIEEPPPSTVFVILADHIPAELVDDRQPVRALRLPAPRGRGDRGLPSGRGCITGGCGGGGAGGRRPHRPGPPSCR